MLNSVAKVERWLEKHYVAPAFAGWLLLGFTAFFFLAAINTMAGWLYVISGGSLALLVVAGVLPERSLRGIQIQRAAIAPVSAGESLRLQLTIVNPTSAAKTLFQVEDLLPPSLGKPQQHVIEELPPQSSQPWFYQIETWRRGVHAWETVQLRTAAPLGLFWCRRTRKVRSRAIIYPQVLNLHRCPLVDQLGQNLQQTLADPRQQTRLSTEGATRSLRPYRHGDPLRLVHWRSSARFGELRVRELEIFRGGQEVILGLDTLFNWRSDDFEQAVIAAASLYFYARRQHPQISLWTGMNGMVQGELAVLETLAAVSFNQREQAPLPHRPLIWLTQNPETLPSLPPGSRWLLWPELEKAGRVQDHPLTSGGIVLQPDRTLLENLQMSQR
uniref:DUF58 domain-containing protein n=1 Tax=Cyanothece sp. (strain PCC 7425 / ATCC 29141) TaxID=395961 RepID=B8HQ03_CYAP4